MKLAEYDKERRQFLVDNFEYRLNLYYPKLDINVGTGNPSADVVIVQPHKKFPERDSITGALKRFGMLDKAYRTTIEIVSNVQNEESLQLDDVNRLYLVELIDLIKPLIVVACGSETMSVLRNKEVKSFQGHVGKRFKSPDITDCTLYAVTDPMTYGFSRASQELKNRGKKEWERLARLYEQEKEKQEKERWD